MNNSRPECTSKVTRQHSTIAAALKCPVHKPQAEARIALSQQRGQSLSLSAAPPKMRAVERHEKSGLPVWTPKMGGSPKEGCHNIGFGEVEYLGSNTLGVPSRGWAGTWFEDCVFSQGIMGEEGKRVRLHLVECYVDGPCWLGDKSTIERSQVVGDLLLGDSARASHTEARSIRLSGAHSGVTDCHSRDGVISAPRYDTEVIVNEERRTPVVVEVDGYEPDTKVHLAHGGIIHLTSTRGEADKFEGLEISGDTSRIVISSSNKEAELRYSLAMKEDDDPLRLDARNEAAWGYLVEIGGVQEKIPGVLDADESLLATALIIKPNGHQ